MNIYYEIYRCMKNKDIQKEWEFISSTFDNKFILENKHNIEFISNLIKHKKKNDERIYKLKKITTK